MPWTASRVAQRGKVYVQAVNRAVPNGVSPDGGKYTVGLGYMKPHGELTDATVATAVEALNRKGDRIWTLRLYSIDDRDQRHDPADPEKALKDAIKDYALTWSLESEQALATVNAGRQKDLRHLTFGEFVEEVFKVRRPKKVAALTWQAEEERLPKLLNHFKDVKLSDLNTRRWDHFIAVVCEYSTPRTKGRGAHKDQTPKPMAPRTKAIFQALYREVLKMAKFLGAIKELHEFETITGSSKPTLEITPLTVREVGKLLDGAPSPMYRALFATGIGGALRPGELMRMHWEDVDWKALRPNPTPKGEKEAPSSIQVRGTKTALSEAPIPMIDFLERELKAWWEACGKPTTGLCWSYRGKELASFDTALKHAAVKAGIDRPGRRWHANMLRHTFAVLAAYSDPPVPIRTAMAMMRHSKVDMLMQVYTRAGHMMVEAGLGNFPLK